MSKSNSVVINERVYGDFGQVSDGDIDVTTTIVYFILLHNNDCVFDFNWCKTYINYGTVLV